MKKSQHKKKWAIALAYVGALTGAGLASGQELLQYFIPFGIPGLVAVIIVGVLHALYGGITVSMGSYFMAKEQNQVLNNIAPKPVQKILDFGLMLTCFVLGFVMIAGAGSNLNQQFDTPLWLGSLICAGLCFVVSLFDFQKVTKVIGSFTPFIVAFITIATIYAFTSHPVDFKASEAIAVELPTTLPNPWISLLNYFSMCIMTGSAIAFVLGGDEYDNHTAHKGGLVGGTIVGIVTVMECLALFVSVARVKNNDLPMQALISEIHPIMGVLISVIIYGMIFNTAISLYYAFARRLVGDDQKKFVPTMGILCASGFAMSFLGFKTLLSIVFPAIGYLGFILIADLFYAYFKNKTAMKSEGSRRKAIFRLIMSKSDPNEPFRYNDYMELRQLMNGSPVNNMQLKDWASSTADKQLESWDKKEAKEDVETPNPSHVPPVREK